nr:A393 [uncultured bacterium]
MVSRLKMVPASLLLAGLAGCASVPADWGRADVGKMTAERGRAMPQVADAKAFTIQALRDPLTAGTAVQLALINNPDVRREAARLGFAAAEVYEAGRLANPTFSLTRLAGDSSAGANVPQLTLGIAFNFVNLLFLPANTRYAQAQFEAAKLGVASSALNLSAQVETAWFDAVGDDQLAQMRDAAAKAQRASADLAQRYFDAGNISARELAMEQAAASQAMLAAISARAAAVESRSSLNRLMGLSAERSGWSLDARLPEPLPQDDDVAALQKLALDSRLDLAGLRRTSEALAARFGLTRHTRLINGLEIGVERERDYDGALDVGPTLELELPLFNWGGGRVAAAQAALDQAEAELDGRVLDVSNEVQLAAAKVGATRSLAQEYRSALIPHQEAVVAQAQKEQNYMLIGIFEVILAKQQEYEAYAGYIEAVRDYWAARTELARAVGRELPSTQQPASPSLDATEILRPKGGGGMDHSKHSMGGMSHDMKGMDMESMPGMSGMDHSQHGKSAPALPSPKGEMDDGTKMKDMPGRSGMDHSEHGKSAPSPSQPKDGMEGMSMKGMDHGDAHDAAPAPGGTDEPPPDCAALKTMDLKMVDPTVAAALRTRCASTSDPRAGHDMGDQPMEGMDHGSPKPDASAPEAPHAH